MLSRPALFWLLVWLMVFPVTYAAGEDLLETGVSAFDAGDYESAVKVWLPLAKQGDVEAQLFMGVLYAHGLGVEHNQKQSAFWYERAAANGDVDAQNEIGLLYEYGWGVKQNDWVAESWYQKVREQDYCLNDTLPTGRLVLPD